MGLCADALHERHRLKPTDRSTGTIPLTIRTTASLGSEEQISRTPVPQELSR